MSRLSRTSWLTLRFTGPMRAVHTAAPNPVVFTTLTSRRPTRAHSARSPAPLERGAAGVGRGPVAVDPLLLDVVDLAVGGDHRQAAVGLEPQLLLGHVV